MATYVVTAILTYVRNRYDFHDVEENITLQKKADEGIKTKTTSKEKQNQKKKKHQKWIIFKAIEKPNFIKRSWVFIMRLFFMKL